jgi:hypothetical protein
VNVELIRQESGSFTLTTERTSISKKDKLELTMFNLCFCLKISKLYWVIGPREVKYFKPDGDYSYQSASNTVLQLSEDLAKKISCEVI